MVPMNNDKTTNTGSGIRFCSSNLGGRNIETPAKIKTPANPVVITASGICSTMDEKPKLVIKPIPQITKASR
jgi:hypothetical protein